MTDKADRGNCLFLAVDTLQYLLPYLTYPTLMLDKPIKSSDQAQVGS